MKYIAPAFFFTACILVLVRLWLAVHGVDVDLIPGPQELFPPQAVPLESFAAEEVGLPSSPTLFQDQKTTRLYIIRVVDSASKDPISHAKVWVEIGDLPEKRNGYTDARGAFMFAWQVTKAHIKTHITVEAAGYATTEDFGVLTEERLIQLSKTK